MSSHNGNTTKNVLKYGGVLGGEGLLLCMIGVYHKIAEIMGRLKHACINCKWLHNIMRLLVLINKKFSLKLH